MSIQQYPFKRALYLKGLFVCVCLIWFTMAAMSCGNYSVLVPLIFMLISAQQLAAEDNQYCHWVLTQKNKNKNINYKNKKGTPEV